MQATDPMFVQVPGEEPPAAEPTPAAKTRKPKAKPAAEKPAARRFRVQLKDNKPFVVEAADAHEAWAKYRGICGILATVHVPDIGEVEDAETEG